MSKDGKQTETMPFSLIGSLVRAGLNTAPFAGGIASLWSDWDTSRRFGRVELAIRNLGEQLSHVKAFDPSRLGDPEMQLLEDVLQRVAREHREVKREMFVRLLAANWVHVELPFDERLLFQRALDEFDQVHLQLMGALGDAHRHGRELVPSEELCRLVFGEAADEQTRYGVFVPALNKLAAEYGFVRRRGMGHGKLMSGINPDGLVFHVNCLLGPLGRRFLESLHGGIDRELVSATG